MSGSADDDIDRNEYGGDVASDVSYFRHSGALVRFSVVRGITCDCGSGEVYQPMQTMDMPMIFRCLWCGEVAPGGDFDRSPETVIEPGGDA